MTTSTPSTQTDLGITEGHIGKINELNGAVLRKRGGNFRPADVQLMLERSGSVLQDRFFSLVEELVVATANVISIRTVKVNRNRSPKEMVAALNRAEYTDNSVVKIIPRGEGDEVTVEFFKLGKWVSVNDLALEFEKRGLTPDPYAQAAVNEADPAFADEYPNGTQWKDENGNWCYIAFSLDGNGRYVDVYRRRDDWYDYWWLGGVRKSRTPGQ